MKNIFDFINMKNSQKKITMVTCYDFAFANLLNKTEIDCLLVGDSVAMVIHGFESTIHADIGMMALHTKAVRRGASDKFIIADMPFLAHRQGLKNTMKCVDALMKAGANAVKIEINQKTKDISYIVQSGVPVVAHLGLTPQSVHQMGGYKVQGKSKSQHELIVQLAKDCAEQGAFMLVLECVPTDLATEISNTVDIPVIGIGAGKNVDGQVLVLNDLLGFNQNFQARFVRQYDNGEEWFIKNLQKYIHTVKEGEFPSAKESFL